MPRHRRNERPTPLDAGDVEIYHPDCRTRILITGLDVRVGDRPRRPHLYIEGICPSCNRYVRLALAREAANLSSSPPNRARLRRKRR